MTTTTSRRLALGVFAPMLIAATAASAQSLKGDARWEAWLGCWQSVQQATSTAPASAVVCVTPLSSASAVEVATLNQGKVIGRDTIDASGEKHAIATQGCTGWQRADWSRDERRVYLTSEVSCGSSQPRTSTGVIAMTPGGDWLDIQSASANGNSGVRANRYREVGPWYADLPTEFASVISARTRLPYAARALAGSEVTPKDVIEVVTRVDSLVVETWLAERGQRFDLDARTLIALADARVPGSVTDVMIGVSYPSKFAVARRGTDPIATGTDVRGMQNPSMSASRAMVARCSAANDPMWYPQMGYDPCGYRAGYYGYGYGAYGYNPYGYGSYGYYQGGYSTPVVVVRGNDKPEPPHGKVVNGSGYTRRGNEGIMSDSPQRESSGATRGSSQSGSSGRSTGSSSSGSSTGSSSSGSSSSGRTAQARKGGG